MKHLLNFEREAYHIVIISSNRLDYSKVMEEIVRISSRGYRKFTIHVVSNIESPLYLKKLRGLIQNNIAYTITIRHYSHSGGEIEELLSSLKNLPHKVLGKQLRR